MLYLVWTNIPGGQLGCFQTSWYCSSLSLLLSRKGTENSIRLWLHGAFVRVTRYTHTDAASCTLLLEVSSLLGLCLSCEHPKDARARSVCACVQNHRVNEHVLHDGWPQLRWLVPRPPGHHCGMRKEEGELP
eukprot:2357704-Amphidinium_carterae.1